jgi:imidazolonepropionase-like amidohydrolase
VTCFDNDFKTPIRSEDIITMAIQNSLTHRMLYVIGFWSGILTVAIATHANAIETPVPGEVSSVLFRNVRVFDGTNDKLADGMNVLIQGKVITKIDATNDFPSDAKIIEGHGRVLMPGLIDLHCHPMIVGRIDEVFSEPREYLVFRAAKVMESALKRGFTSIRDAGGTHYGFARAANEGLIPSPRIFHSGAVLTQTGGHGDFRRRIDPQPAFGLREDTRDLNGLMILADGTDEIQRAVRENLRLGATQIKIMASGGGASPYDHLGSVQYSTEEIVAAVQAARDWGTYIFAHAYTDAAIERCIENGVRCIEHGNLVTPALFQKLKVTEKLRDTENKVYFVPTLVTFFAFSGDTETLGLNPEDATRLRDLLQMVGFRANQQQKIQVLAQHAIKSLELLEQQGVRIGFGTDLIGGYVDQESGEIRSFMELQSREFRIRRRVYSDIEILKQATSISAEILGMSGHGVGLKGDRVGVIEVGALADVLLIEGDPANNVLLLEDPNNIVVIMKSGAIYKDASK